MRYYTEELKRLLRDHPFGLTLREAHDLARKYDIPSRWFPYEVVRGFWSTYKYDEYYYSHELAIALAIGLRDGWVVSDDKGWLSICEVKYC